MTDFRFITKSNFNRIANALSSNTKDLNINEIHDAIFHINLSKILNAKEAKEKYIQLKLLNNDEYTISRLIELLEKVSKTLSMKSLVFIFDQTIPKYHLDPGCKFLNSSYLNFEIPEIIKDRGDEEIDRFKAYCLEHKKEISVEDDKEREIFWRKTNAIFKIPDHFYKPIKAKNSGYQTIVHEDEEVILKNIMSSYEKCMELLDDNQSNTYLKNFQYSKPTSKDLDTIPDGENRRLVQKYRLNKKIIIENLFYYYAAKANIKNAGLPQDILKNLHMQPCKGCHK